MVIINGGGPGKEAEEKLLEEKAIAKLSHPNIVELKAILSLFKS